MSATAHNVVPLPLPNFGSALCLFPLPHQVGAPYFDGKDVTDFIIKWEDLTLDWSDDQRIKKIPLYSDKLIGRYLKTWPTYTGADWDEFKDSLLEEFREDDIEQQRNTETYLQNLVQEMRKETSPSVGKSRAFIFEFTERSDQLVEKAMINQHTRVILFLQAFSDRIGDKLCKRCRIDVENSATTIGVWNQLKREALKVCTKDDSQMSKLWKAKRMDESTKPQSIDKIRPAPARIIERPQEIKVPGRRKVEELDDVTQLMKELKLSQLEAQKRHDEQISFMRDVFMKSAPSPFAQQAPPYYSPNQYGNREYPPSPGNKTNIRGCYWDGRPHGRESCEELLKAISRGEVHKKGKVLYLGQEGVGDAVRVPVPTEENGKIVWQQEWVREQLLKKESVMPRANCVTVEEEDEDDSDCQLVKEEINGIPVVYIATEEADVEEKRGRSLSDEGDKENKKPRTAGPVARRTPKILKRGISTPPIKPRQDKLWATLRESVNLEELSKRTLDAPVPGVTVRELLSISPDLIQQWFGIKRVPPLGKEKPDALINSAKWKDSLKRLYACASPKCKGLIGDNEVKLEMLIDSGAELCLMSKDTFEELDIPIDLDIDWTVGSANSQRSRVYGVCHDVPVTIGGITARCRFFVLDSLSQDVILGRPWERVVRAKHDNRDDGSCYTTISDGDGNTATFCSVPSNHERNRSKARNTCKLTGKEQGQ